MSQPEDSTTPDRRETAVPKAVASRLSLYLRELQWWLEEGRETISSHQLGRRLGCSDAQVRKDLGYFGQFGYPGRGYKCRELIDAIRRILGTDRSWQVALVGCGHLGQALLGHRGFHRRGFDIVGAFDSDPQKQGLTFGNVTVQPMEAFRDFVREHAIRLAVLTVPAAVAQEVADGLVATGVTGILNFAPVTLALPRTVQVVGVDLAIELEQLAFAVLQPRP